jgi:RNase P/RNase MRP subunit POP5
MLAKYCNKWTRVAVVRVRHGAHRLVASCLPLLQHVEKQSVIVRTLYIGATLQQCYRFIQVGNLCRAVMMPNERKYVSCKVLPLLLLSCCV